MAVYKIPAYADYAKGTSTGTGGQQTIAHGLSAKPTVVKIYPTEDPAGTAITWGSPAADATNIYLTVTSGKDYTWEAILEA